MAQEFTIKNLLPESMCKSSSSSIEENVSLNYDIQESGFENNWFSMNREDDSNMTVWSSIPNTHNNLKLFNNHISPALILNDSPNIKPASPISKIKVALNIRNLQ